MAQTPEGRVKAKIRSWLKAKGIYAFAPIGSAYGTHGIPDIICCVDGRFIGIECKAPGKEKTTTCNQDQHIAAITASGGVAFVATSLEDVVASFAKFGII